MAEDDKQQERRRNRGRKAAHVIEAKAIDVTPTVAPVADDVVSATPTAVSPVEGIVAPSAQEPIARAESSLKDAASVPAPDDVVQTEAKVEMKADEAPPHATPSPAPQPDIIAPPVIPPPPPPRYAMPLAAAGLAGALFGAVGGAIVPGLVGGSPPPPVAPAADVQRLQRLEQGLAALQTRSAPAAAPAPASGFSAEEGTRLVQRLTALEAELAGRIAAQEQQINQRIDTRIAAIPAPPASGAPPPVTDLAPLAGRLDGMEKALADLDRRAQAATETAKAAAAEGLKAVEPQLADLGRKADAAMAAAAAGVKALEPKLADLTAGLSRTSQRVETTAAAPLLGAAQALNQAFLRGAPFTLELSALEALGVKPEQLQDLRGLAEKGAPSAQQIAEAFRPLAMAAARAGQPAASGAQAVFDSFVRSRASGPGAADTPDGLVSTIENALKRGDVTAALGSWAKLPEASRAATEAWAATARQREAARQAIRAIEEQALAALRKSVP